MGKEGGGIRSEEGVGMWGEEEEGGGRVGEKVDNTYGKELVFTHLSDATISAALIWTICDFHGSIHRSGFSYIKCIHNHNVQELLIHVCTQVSSQPE